MSEPHAVLSSLGAYLLGALGPTERVQVEEHLRGCPQCREELAGLAGLPGLLATLDQTDLEQLDDRAPEAGSRLLERTLLELTRRRQAVRRRNRWLASAAAVVVALATSAVLVRGTLPQDAASARSVTGVATGATTGVHAEVRLTPQPWGTALHLMLRGVPPGTHCQLVAVLADGQRQVTGSWQASYEGTASIDAAADARPDQLTGLEVVTDKGIRLVSIPAPHR